MNFKPEITAYIKITRPVNVLITFITIIVASVICTDGSYPVAKIIFAAVSASFTAGAGNIINDDTDLKKLSEAKKGAYLRRVSDGAVLSESAKKTYEKVKGAVSGKKIKVLDTGLGWLRVRDLPNLNGKELAKVNVGEQFLVLEEKPGWTKIKVSETVQGWVSSDYVQEVKVVIKVN